MELTLSDTVRLPDEDTDELMEALPLGLDRALTVTHAEADTDTLAESLPLDDKMPVRDPYRLGELLTEPLDDMLALMDGL